MKDINDVWEKTPIPVKMGMNKNGGKKVVDYASDKAQPISSFISEATPPYEMIKKTITNKLGHKKTVWIKKYIHNKVGGSEYYG